jgi:2-hydroxy-3-keto-5-methylthiopentenyl-1-phosphate phosphatase
MSSAIARPGAKSPNLAVFCDYDGTFSVQDVGSTLARRHRAEARAKAWARYEQGQLTAWAYNLEVLDGMKLPPAALDTFLRSVELDPGARLLLDWCRRRDVPFRILSDGFDYNLDRLQQIHQVAFDYDANHLHYESDAWRIAAGYPNPACGCGTGTCKRGRIETWRRAHPSVAVVHIGNGAVSDLCGALAADAVFAKDTLAEVLAARKIAFRPFHTLHDVVPALDAMLQERAA